MPRLGFALPGEAPRSSFAAATAPPVSSREMQFNQRLTSRPPFAQGSNLRAPTPTLTSPGAPFQIQMALLRSSARPATTRSGRRTNGPPTFINTVSPPNMHSAILCRSRSGISARQATASATYRNANQLTLEQATIIANLPSGAPIPAAAVAPYAALVGQNGGLLITESSAMMNYNGGQATLRQRVSHGLEYAVNYTYARSMTNSALRPARHRRLQRLLSGRLQQPRRLRANRTGRPSQSQRRLRLRSALLDRDAPGAVR